MKNTHIKYFSGIAIIAFLVLVYLQVNLFESISYAVSFTVTMYYLYKHLLWRINPFEKTPKLYGEYKATFLSNYNGGTVHPSHIRIKQNLSNIDIIERADDGYSESVTASVVKTSSTGEWRLYYTYLTHPDPSDHNDMHYGTAILYIRNRNLIEGTYFTNRLHPTAGKLRLERMAK